MTSPLFSGSGRVPGAGTTRRALLKTAGKATAVAAAAALALTGCSTGPAASTSGASTSESSSTQFPVTIKHAFGETTIKEQPGSMTM